MSNINKAKVKNGSRIRNIRNNQTQDLQQARKLQNKETSWGTARARVGLAACYNAIPTPIRMLLSIPVTTAQIIQRNIFPTILFTEGYHVFRQNFGFSRDKLINNILLGGMVFCAASKFKVNPWFDKEHEAIEAIWFKVSDKTVSDEEYYAEFYPALWSFAKALSVFVSTEILNGIFQSLVNRAITFKRQYEFVQEWLSDYAAYGINASNVLSGLEADNEKANLNPVKLFEDIENQSGLLSLWNTRINTIISCITAIYALSAISPSIELGTIILPKLLLLCIGYSLFFNALISFFEGPARILLQKMNQLKDSIIRQINNIDSNAELITFLEGEKFEAKKLLKLLRKKREKGVKYDLINSGKQYMVNFIKSFEWLFPILATMEDVRSGHLKLEQVGLCLHHNSRINSAFTCVKDNFDQLSITEEGTRRLSLYEERLQAWRLKCAEINEKIKESDKISFSGRVFADDKHEKLLARGSFTLQPGSITHFDAPSGFGKTTLFRIFRRVWGDFKGSCTLPGKAHLAFLPSHVYVLGSDEPLFQTVSYPVKSQEAATAENLKFVKKWMKDLKLKDHVYNNLGALPLGNDKANTDSILKITNWMNSLSDGERKRVAFCNILLKLHTQEIKFLVMDEPFKGIDSATQKVMVKLLKEALPDGCTVLFSNHEENHGLNTHILAVDKTTKHYSLKKNS